MLEDEERFAARQGFRLADAWAEKAGPEPEVAQIEEAAAQAREGVGAQKTEPPALPSRPGRSRKKGRFKNEEIERSPERVFLPGQKNPLVLRQNTGELFLLARLRDEAHRFAITFHRKLRRERNFRSVLEQIPGVGEKRKRALLAHFGSLKRIRAATPDEIAQVEGFNLQAATRIDWGRRSPGPRAHSSTARIGGRSGLDGCAPCFCGREQSDQHWPRAHSRRCP